MKAAPSADTCPGPAPWTAELPLTSRGAEVLEKAINHHGIYEMTLEKNTQPSLYRFFVQMLHFSADSVKKAVATLGSQTNCELILKFSHFVIRLNRQKCIQSCICGD